MQIFINSDSSLTTDQRTIEWSQMTVSSTLVRFADRLTRIELHVSDVNGIKRGERDKRCLLEARPAGQDPVAVTSVSSSLSTAVKSAVKKMERLLETRFSRQTKPA